jgi:malonyl-CoA O-methyltransferase
MIAALTKLFAMPLSRKEIITRNFDRAVPTYESGAFFQDKAAEAILDLCPKNACKILDAGCGTGLLTEKLAQKYPQAKIEAIDLSQKSIQYAKARQAQPAIQYAVEDVEKLSNDRTGYDLITLNLTAHWFETPLETLRDLQGRLGKTGILLYTVPAADNWPEWHELKPSDAEPDYFKTIAWLGLQKKIEHSKTYPKAADFLHHLHQTGVQASFPGQAILGPTALKHICRQFDKGPKIITWKAHLGRLRQAS